MLEGYAALAARGVLTTTGGAGGVEMGVADETGLRRAASLNSSAIINVQGMIELSGKFYVKSNKTLRGIGANSGIRGDTIRIQDEQNVIFSNLSLGHCDDDGVRVYEGSHHVWIDHCLVEEAGDGLIDFPNADYVTISWCLFRNHYKNFLWYGTTTSPKVTFHHNLLLDLHFRTPQVRDGGLAHLYNNVFQVHESDALRARTGAKILSENNWFEEVEEPFREDGGTIEDRGSVFVNTDRGNISQQSFTPPYGYTLQTANLELVNLLHMKAGPLDVIIPIPPDPPDPPDPPIPPEPPTKPHYSYIVKTEDDKELRFTIEEL